MASFVSSCRSCLLLLHGYPTLLCLTGKDPTSAPERGIFPMELDERIPPARPTRLLRRTSDSLDDETPLSAAPSGPHHSGLRPGEVSSPMPIPQPTRGPHSAQPSIIVGSPPRSINHRDVLEYNMDDIVQRRERAIKARGVPRTPLEDINSALIALVQEATRKLKQKYSPNFVCRALETIGPEACALLLHSLGFGRSGPSSDGNRYSVGSLTDGEIYGLFRPMSSLSPKRAGASANRSAPTTATATATANHSASLTTIATATATASTPRREGNRCSSSSGLSQHASSQENVQPSNLEHVPSTKSTLYDSLSRSDISSIYNSVYDAALRYDANATRWATLVESHADFSLRTRIHKCDSKSCAQPGNCPQSYDFQPDRTKASETSLEVNLYRCLRVTLELIRLVDGFLRHGGNVFKYQSELHIRPDRPTHARHWKLLGIDGPAYPVRRTKEALATVGGGGAQAALVATSTHRRVNRHVVIPHSYFNITGGLWL